MSDDLERDEPRDRIRPSRPSPMHPGAPAGRSRPTQRETEYEEATPPKRGGGGKVVLIVLAIVGVLGLCCLGGAGTGGYFIFRGVSSGRNKVYVSNNYKQLAMGMHQYQDVNRHFPPPAMKTRDGKAGLSWRVAILPYIEQDSLYRQFKINEAWNHPDNLKLADKMPAIFAPRRGEGGKMTHARVFVGREAIFDPNRPQPRNFAELVDGSSNTIMIVEATKPVLWIQPDELPFDPKGPLPALGLPDNDFFTAAFADGSVRFLEKDLNPSILRAAIGVSDGIPVDLGR